MTNEELLEEAKRRYPVGAKYKPIEPDGTIGCYKNRVEESKYPPNIINYDNFTIECGVGFVYAKGKWAEIVSLPENKEVIPEYVECIGLKEDKAKGWSNYFTIGKIYKINSTISTSGWIYIVGDGEYDEWACDYSQFKPSTKEAFDAQNQPKQPLKQAVHCKTQEEWDFVLSKLPTSSKLSQQSNMFPAYNNSYEDEGGIAVNIKSCAYCGIGWYKNNDYQILSFQEWCYLNGYKMDSRVKFEAGKWYKGQDNSYRKCSINGYMCKYSEMILNGIWMSSSGDAYWSPDLVTDLSEIQQYLPDGHPDKIKVECEIESSDFEDLSWNTVLEFRGGSDAILSHHNYVRNTLINESATKMYGIFKVEAKDLDWCDLIQESYFKKENPMILSIDDEELPMVSVIKTNTIKQLLNN